MKEVTCTHNLMNRYIAGEKYKYTPLRTQKGSVKGVYITWAGHEQIEYLPIDIFNDHFTELVVVDYSKAELMEAARRVRVKNASSK